MGGKANEVKLISNHEVGKHTKAGSGVKTRGEESISKSNRKQRTLLFYFSTLTKCILFYYIITLCYFHPLAHTSVAFCI